MRTIADCLVEILKELKIIRRHLEEITKCKFFAGNLPDYTVFLTLEESEAALKGGENE